MIVARKSPQSKSHISKTSIKKQRSKSTDRLNNCASCHHKGLDKKMCEVIRDIKNKNEKLNSSIGIHTLLKANQQQQRCLQHNNVCTLYCLNDKRILCVNCMYGVHNHRTHKVVPMMSCLDDINNDIMNMVLKIDAQLKEMQFLMKVATLNTRQVQSYTKELLKQLEQEFNSKIKAIKDKYYTEKGRIESIYGSLTGNCKDVEKELQNYKSNLNDSVSQYSRQIKTYDQNEIIMKHIIYTTLTQLGMPAISAISTQLLAKLYTLKSI